MSPSDIAGLARDFSVCARKDIVLFVVSHVQSLRGLIVNLTCLYPASSDSMSGRLLHDQFHKVALELMFCLFEGRTQRTIHLDSVPLGQSKRPFMHSLLNKENPTIHKRATPEIAVEMTHCCRSVWSTRSTMWTMKTAKIVVGSLVHLVMLELPEIAKWNSTTQTSWNSVLR